MRTLRSHLVPLVAGMFFAGSLVVPAMAQNDSGNGAQQGDNNQQWNCPSCTLPGDGSAAQQQYQDQQQQYQDQQQQYQQQPQNDQGEQDQRNPAMTVDSAPPPFPVDAYDQPPCPGDGYEWTPGYWGWDDGWDWVPGAWVYPPYVGGLWTPGYWGWGGGMYGWYPGYWGLSVGFYGGIFYGGGYWGEGFEGGYWNRGNYYNNTNVNNITNINNIHSYNGPSGPNGFNPHQFNTATNPRGTAGRSAQMTHAVAAGGRTPMNASVVSANQYAAAHGGKLQGGNGRPYSSVASRSTNMASHSFNTASRSLGNTNRGMANGGSRSLNQTGNRSVGQSTMASNRMPSNIGRGTGGQRPLITANRSYGNGSMSRGYGSRGYTSQGSSGFGGSPTRSYNLPRSNGYSGQRSFGGGSSYGGYRGGSSVPRAYSSSRGYGGGLQFFPRLWRWRLWRIAGWIRRITR